MPVPAVYRSTRQLLSWLPLQPAIEAWTGSCRVHVLDWSTLRNTGTRQRNTATGRGRGTPALGGPCVAPSTSSPPRSRGSADSNAAVNPQHNAETEALQLQGHTVLQAAIMHQALRTSAGLQDIRGFDLVAKKCCSGCRALPGHQYLWRDTRLPQQRRPGPEAPGCRRTAWQHASRVGAVTV